MGRINKLNMKVLLLVSIFIALTQGLLITQAKMNQVISGTFINNQYKIGQMNTWHVVNLKSIANNKLMWTNKAKVSWIMTAHHYKNTANAHVLILSVGKNPYSAKGYKWSWIVQVKKTGVMWIAGPFKEHYVRVNKLFA